MRTHRFQRLSAVIWLVLFLCVLPNIGCRSEGGAQESRTQKEEPPVQRTDSAAAADEDVLSNAALDGRLQAVLTAVNEVRPPIILATLAVIISFVPLFFITGMMGPYMRPIPINASAAMLFSLIVAFVVSPWLTFKLFRRTFFDQVQLSSEGFLIDAELFARAQSAGLSWRQVGVPHRPRLSGSTTVSLSTVFETLRELRALKRSLDGPAVASPDTASTAKPSSVRSMPT